MKAILLAGGKGTRLRPLTVHTPKPIVPILNRPFLYYQIDLLRQVPEIDEVILSLNYQPRRIEEILSPQPRAPRLGSSPENTWHRPPKLSSSQTSHVSPGATWRLLIRSFSPYRRSEGTSSRKVAFSPR